ncbi:hypothetical protein UFOVP250_27 [uncultured Caudovirales phage]|uniref:Uncharacterized protein n=1 Tax=uncultured Caudovirales phage TaxID=2100421 RepID=A0A6J5LJ60_9CAUD|nr:hypothetical protein UFOVP250_27 [uncultured Caudovirales phage]
MITKKLKNQIFAWDQLAFNGKGYWFVLGKNGGLGLAASKAQAKRLGQPKDQVNAGDDKEVTPKVISEKTKNVIPKQKAKLKNIANTKRKNNKIGQSEEDDKLSEVKSSGKKVGNLDTALYTSVAEDQKQRLMKGDGLANIATKLVNFYKQTQEEKKLQRELNRNFAKELHEQEKRHQEQMLKDLKSPKMKKTKLEKMSKIGKLEHPETAARLAGEEEELGFFGELGAALRTAATTVVETIGALATPEVLGTAAVIASTIYASQAIAGAESGGNPDVTFGDTVVKGVILRRKYLSPEQSKFHKPLTQMTLTEVEEFQRIREKLSPNTGAVGKYGFMHSTLFGSKGRPGLVQQLGLDMNTPFNVDVQEKLNALMQKQNIQQLQNKGVPITPGYQYMATYIGAKGTSEVYQSIQKGENKTVAQIMLEHGHKVGEKNPELYKIHAQDFEKILEDRLIKKGHLTPKAIETPNVKSNGNNLNKKSADVVSDKKNKNNNTQVMVNKSTNIVNNQSKNTKEIIIEEKRDDTPLILQGH